MLIDTHCHLTDDKFTDVAEVLRRAKEASVETVIIPSTSLADAKKAVAMAEREKQYCLVGIHPEEVERVFDGENNSPEAVYKELDRLIKSTKRVVGVGEVGLDFYYDKEKKTKEKQLELFRQQIKLAQENNLPVAIHMRGDAEEEMREVLLAHSDAPLRGQFHCFAGSASFLKFVLDMGFYVSFCGNITYKSAGDLRELLQIVPLNRLLLETDSPYLPPEPLRGTVNTPANVKITAEFVAEQMMISLIDLAKATSKNTKCLYCLEI